MRIVFILIFLIALIASVLITISSTHKETQKIPEEKYCLKDEDCVSAQCCHPTDCVNVDHKPSCKGIMCTMECRPGTMDCGQGYCACVNNECKAIIKG